MKQNPRVIATQVLTEAVRNKLPLNQVISKQKSKYINKFKSNKQFAGEQITADFSLMQALCYGVIRHYLQLQFITKLLLAKPLPNKHLLVQHLLYIGIFQLLYMRVPDHAAIFETVAAVKQLKIMWAEKLVNGVLRKVQREKDNIMAKVATDSEASTNHPMWLLKLIRENWAEQYPEIISANNAHPPNSVRVNMQCCNMQEASVMFSKHGIQSQAIASTTAGLMIKTNEDLTLLPEFKAGIFSMQDGAAQLAAQLLDLQPGQVVLDACAAPGGKTCHMLELQPDIKLTALDKSAARVDLIKQNIQRLRLPEPNIMVADATQVQEWWNNTILFDRILIDAPCSATGIIRRQPDIKLFRTVADIATLANQQLKLLTNLWPLLKPSGIMLYATCSILPTENEQLLAQFIAKHDDAKPIKIIELPGISLDIGHQILPGQTNMDGFYYAKLVKGK